MTRGMQHLQSPVPQLQHITVLDQSRCGRSPDPVLGVAQRAIRMRLEHVVADEVPGQGIGSGRRGEDFRLGGVHQAFGELVMAGDMVEVGMTGHRQQWPLGEPGQLLAQADQAGAGVDQGITVTALYMPEVAAVEGSDIGLVDQADAVMAMLHLKPLVAADYFHGGAFSVRALLSDYSLADRHRCFTAGTTDRAAPASAARPSTAADAAIRHPGTVRGRGGGGAAAPSPPLPPPPGRTRARPPL